MKSVIVTMAVALVLVIPASAQWLRTEKKNLITGKTETTFALQSQEPEKGVLLLLCDGGVHPVENRGGPLQLKPGFQVKRIGFNSQFFHEYLFRVPVRLDNNVDNFVAALSGDLDDVVDFNRRFSINIVTSKEIVLELPAFGGTVHQMLFKAAEPPLPLDAKGKLLMCQ